MNIHSTSLYSTGQ